MNEKQARILPLQSTKLGSSPAASAGISANAQVGVISAINADGSIMVSLPASATPFAARLAVAADAEQLQRAFDSHQPVVLVFENGALNKPIIVGFITAPAIGSTDTRQEGPLIEVDADGRRVRLTAKDEVVLECGAASITLRRNGRVVIRGTHIESDSDGANRIKGGQVRIN